MLQTVPRYTICWLYIVSLLLGNPHFAQSQTVYKGCFEVTTDMTGLITHDSLTIDIGIEECYKQGYQFAGLQYGSRYWCSNDIAFLNSNRLTDASCDMDCSGNNQQKCGGAWRRSIYAIGR
ncbi:WSC domain-containing protein ARB_07867-like [Anneissia japonica]|uniref:WSC domain-containing protein ARB_07867-like n=1 Tax=Anneissia japonica TaxID=1529436 RepID=UPI00142585D2|nr:WSC domain-containing protein ARB_07867-like [Anneissia japonica]